MVFLVPLLFFRCEFLVTLCSGCLVFHLLVVQFLLKRIVALCISDGNHDHNDRESQSAEPEEGVDDVENCIKNVFHIVAFLLLAKKIIIAVVVGEVGEIISCAAVSTQRLAVSDLLDISKTTGHALVSVGVESVESDRYPCIVDILDRARKVITLRKKELITLDEFIKARFVEMFGDENNSKNWDIVNVEEVAEVQVGVVIKPCH